MNESVKKAYIWKCITPQNVKLISLLFALTLYFGTSAQAASDPRLKVWSNPNFDDSTRVHAMNTYVSEKLLYSDTDSAIELLSLVRSFSEEKNFTQGVAAAQRTLGMAFYVKGNYPSALTSYWNALALFQSLDSKLEVAKTQTNIGLIFQNLGQYSKAIQYYDSSLRVFNRYEDYPALSKVYTNLGNIHMRLGQYQKSEEYHAKSLAIDKRVENKKGQASSYGNIGLLHLFQGNLDTAHLLFEKCMKIFEEIDDLRAVAGTYSNFAKIYQRKGDNEKALEYFKISLKQYEEIGDSRGIIFANYEMYQVLNKLNRHQEAIERCELSQQMAKEMSSVSRQRDACLCLYETHKEIGQFNQALAYLEVLNGLEDSMALHEGDKKIQALEFEQTMYRDSMEQVAHNQLKEIEYHTSLRSKTVTKNVALGSAIVLIFLSWGIYNRYQRAQTQKKLSDERVDRLLKEEELKVMDALIEGRDSERKRISADLHDELGSKVSALRYTWASIYEKHNSTDDKSVGFDAMDKLVDQLAVLVKDFVRRQSSSNAANFGIKNSLDELRDLIQVSHKIELNSFIQESINVKKQTELELYKIILELVSNAIKYAQASYINIHLSHQDNELVMIVEDDGLGFEQNRVKLGMGLKNIGMRARRIGGEVEIDSQPGKGTTVILKAVA